jgi:hypothetical protein
VSTGGPEEAVRGPEVEGRAHGWWMAGGSVLSWLVVTLATANRVNPEMLFGMLGPLVSAELTLALARQTFASNPERLTGVMIAGFWAKMVFFGAYVVVMLRVLMLRPVPFIVSFTSYFIALYAAQAILLRRMFAAAGRPPARQRDTVD